MTPPAHPQKKNPKSGKEVVGQKRKKEKKEDTNHTSGTCLFLAVGPE